MTNQIHFADNLDVLRTLADGSVDLIYIDPPFNTGKTQRHTRIRTVRDAEGDRTGFAGQRYRTEEIGTRAFRDVHDDYLGFLEPRLREAHRVLSAKGTLYVHLDCREVHYVKVLLDSIFGRERFLNEVIWAYDYGARTKRRWPAKHDNILVYVKDPKRYFFDQEAVDRIPYMAPGLVGAEKAARGKVPTDCYSDDTQILTDQGWIPFPKLHKSHGVATVTPEGTLGFAPPVKLHAYPYQGHLLAFQTRTIDLCVTPNHRLYVRPKHGREYVFMEASAVAQRDQAPSKYYSFRNRTQWIARTRGTSYEVPPCTYLRPKSSRPLPRFHLEDWCEFLGLYIAEGCTTVYRDRMEVLIAQQNRKHLGRIRRLLQRMGLRFSYDGRSFIICNKQLTLHLRSLGKAHEKSIPREFLALPRRFLARLYKGLMIGDGHTQGTEEVYFTVSEDLANDVQELLLKLGYNANIHIHEPDRRLHPRWRPKFCVSRRVSRESTVFPRLHARSVRYRGMVYCCTVEPYHTLVVRRNGKPVICGNCWWHTIVPTQGRERTGYPTQKPLGILRRIVKASSRPGDLVLDFFAGSGTTGAAALELGRRFLLVDDNPEAIEVMSRRFGGVVDLEWLPHTIGPIPLAAASRKR